MVLELLVELAAALGPEKPGYMHERAGAGRLGNAQVELPVGRQWRSSGVELGVHFVERRFERAQLRTLRRLRGERRAFGFDHVAGTQELERTGERVRLARVAVRQLAHVDAGSDSNLDEPFHFERDQRLADRRTRDAELAREIALRRQPRAGHELAAANQRADLIRDLAIEP